MDPNLVDLGAYGLCVALVAGYHVYLRARLRHDSSYTIQAVNNEARSAWVENMMSDHSNGVLAVQTLRNSTMAATFLASTAVLLIMGVLNLVHSDGTDAGVLHRLQDSIVAGGDMAQFRLLILVATFFFAFFCFSMAVRMYNHVGYLINSGNAKFCPTPQYVGRLLNRSGRYYSMGMRAYYICVPMVFALFNVYYMVAATMALVFALYHIDRAPDAKAGTGDITKGRRRPEFRFRIGLPARVKSARASTAPASAAGYAVPEPAAARS